MNQADFHIPALPPPASSEQPTVGAIKRALYALSRTTSGSAQGDLGASLREVHDLLCRLARRSGIDPDDAVQQRRTAVESQRKRLYLASATAIDPASG